MEKDELKEELLYACESFVDAHEYKKMARYFPRIYWEYVLGGSVLNMIASIIIGIIARSFVSGLIFFAFCELLVLIVYKVRLENMAEQTFKNRQKKGIVDTNFHTEFYKNYFIRQGETITYKINYSEITRYVETDENIYLKYGKKNLIIIIQKEQCTPELICFIGEKFVNLEEGLKSNKKSKDIKSIDNPSFVKNALRILFILTLFSLIGAMRTWAFIMDITHVHGFDFVKTTWAFWLWLPVPILSIVLGIKYKRAGIKCTKNIVGGFIIGFLLFIYGAFWMFPMFSEDYNKNIAYNYSEINNYKNIIDAELPDDGELIRENYGEFFEQDKREYSKIDVYYDKEDTSKLEDSIINGENWILSSEMKSELKIYISSMMLFDNEGDDYFSIYNKTLKKYNTLPEEAGDYEIYVMKYDIDEQHLEIHRFIYSYK